MRALRRRAREAGKGFAVVANEVRAIAQRSAEAARDIKALIDKSTAHVGDGVSLVGETGTLLAKIVAQVGAVTAQVNEIAETTASQASNLEQANVAVGSIDRMTQQNAAMIEESTATTRSLCSEAQRLGDLVAQFRVSDQVAGRTFQRQEWLVRPSPVRRRLRISHQSPSLVVPLHLPPCRSAAILHTNLRTRPPRNGRLERSFDYIRNFECHPSPVMSTIAARS